MNNSLDIMQQTTWVRTLLFTDNSGNPVGGSGWGAEFVLLNPNNPQQIVAAASTQNGYAAWTGPGQLSLTLPQTVTTSLPVGDYSFFVRIVDPSAACIPADPKGFGMIVLNGTLSVVPAAPSNTVPGFSMPSTLNTASPCSCSPGILTPQAPLTQPFTLGMGASTC